MQSRHRDQVWDLIAAYQLHSGGLPISLAPLANDFPIVPRDLSAVGIYGMLIPPATVVLDVALTADEARLVYAHEIGHALLGHDGTLRSLSVDDWFHTRAERDAWTVAAMLLIPLHAIRWGWTIQQIAADCRVPPSLVTHWQEG